MRVYNVTLCGGGANYCYAPEASSPHIAIRKAFAIHDRYAKERQKMGHQAPQTVAQYARKNRLTVTLAMPPQKKVTVV